MPDLKSATVDMLHARGCLVYDSMDCFSLYQKMLNNIPAVTSQRPASYCPHPARLLSQCMEARILDKSVLPPRLVSNHDWLFGTPDSTPD
jgi:hypothetical protein